MNFNELIKMLPFAPVSMSLGDFDLPVVDIELLDGTQTEFKRETVYFGYEEQIQGEVPEQFIVEASTCNTRHFNNPCWALLPKGTLFSAFNIARSVLSDAFHGNIYDELIKISHSGSDLAACLDTAATYLGETLILIDPEYRVIAHSATKPVPDKIWQENIRKGFCSYEFIQAVRDMGISNLIYENNGPVEVSCSESPYRKYCSAINANGSYAVFLLMITNETLDSPESKLSPSLLEKFANIGRAISQILSVNPLTGMDRSPYQTVLYNLLIGAPPEKLIKRIEVLSFPSSMEALCLSPIRYLAKGFMKEHIAGLFKEIFPGTHITFFDSDIAAVINTTFGEHQAAFAQDSSIERLETFAREHSLRIGISDSFNTIGLFPWYYNQAKTSLKLSSKIRKENSVCKYSDYRIFDLLDHFNEKQKLSAYYHPAIQRLQTYDIKNCTELLHTLDIFLQKNGNIKDSSAALYIHRNSLSYRLERISKIGKISLADPETCMQLWLSCRIAEYLQQL